LSRTWSCPVGHQWQQVGDNTLLCPICGQAPARQEDVALLTLEFSGREQHVPEVPLSVLRLPGYEIIELLAQGGAGAVYKVRDVRLNRVVALKTIAVPQLPSERLLAEAHAVAQLKHRHIVPIYEFGEHQGRCYLIMPLLEGGNLRRQMSRFAARPREIAQLLAKIADALQHAHTKGILHLDIKPDNILLDEHGEPYVTDFGLFAAWKVTGSDTANGSVIGTPAYMAPEQAAGETQRFGPGTDVYGLGVILYEMLTGMLPFRGESIVDTLLQLRERPPVAPRLLNPKVPAELETICLRCLQKSPADRYRSATELHVALKRFFERAPVPPVETVTVAAPAAPTDLSESFGLADEGNDSPLAPKSFFSRLTGWLRSAFPKHSRQPAPAELTRLLGPVLQIVSEGVIIADQDGKLLEMNEAAQRILGLNLKDATIRDWLANQALYHGDSTTPLLLKDLPLTRALSGESITDAEIFLRSPEGANGVWISMTAQPFSSGNGHVGATAVFRDITDRKEQRDNEAFYDSLWDSLRLNVFRKDLDGRYTYANRVFAATMGKPREQVLGQTDFDLYLPALAERYQHDDRDVINTGKVIERIEEHRTSACAAVCRCRAPGMDAHQQAQPEQPQTFAEAGDDMQFVQLLLAPVYGGDDGVVGTQGIFWNITAQRRAERQLARIAAELHHSNTELARSNADLEQFAYVASHDLQEPLRMVASYTTLLQRRYQGKLDADADEFVAFAVDGARRMQTLINDLLVYSRVKSQTRPSETLDCRTVFERAIANLRQTIAESNASVTRGNLPMVKADATQLAQLLQNLIGNALKFRAKDSPRVHVDAERSGSDWRFSVADNGIGIDPKHAERIFAIFQRLHTREKYPGTGIGLAICKKIVERHGGRIWVEPRVGGGSIFYFTLPLSVDSHKG